ncbi:MAG: hypothetical protein ACXWEL_06025, partial [Solirubrobacterales bacterium]
MKVVDGHDHGLSPGERRQGSERRGRDRPTIDRCTTGLFSQERNRKRAPLGARKLSEDRVRDGSEEIRQPVEPERHLVFGGPSRQNCHAPG